MASEHESAIDFYLALREGAARVARQDAAKSEPLRVGRPKEPVVFDSLDDLAFEGHPRHNFLVIAKL